MAEPEGGYEELGVIDQSGHGDIRNAGEFLRSVSPRVCAAGGDGVIARLSDSGQYLGGTVVLLP